MERRQHKRIPFYSFIRYRSQNATITSLRNISGGGILFKSSENIPLGTKLAITINLPPLDRTISTLVEVVRVERKNNQGKYLIGVRFLNITEEDRQAIMRVTESSEKTADGR